MSSKERLNPTSPDGGNTGSEKKPSRRGGWGFWCFALILAIGSTVYAGMGGFFGSLFILGFLYWVLGHKDCQNGQKVSERKDSSEAVNELPIADSLPKPKNEKGEVWLYWFSSILLVLFLSIWRGIGGVLIGIVIMLALHHFFANKKDVVNKLVV
jgi:hypothetical protein